MSVALQTRGRAWVLGDHVDTDDLCRTRYFTRTSEEVRKHLLEDIRPDFVEGVRPGDVLVGGRGFGCGGGHDHAHGGLRAAGIGAVIAASFGGQFLRHAVDHALPPITAPAAVAEINDGDELEVNCLTGEILNVTTGAAWTGVPVSGLLLDIVRGGGIVEYIRRTAPSD